MLQLNLEYCFTGMACWREVSNFVNVWFELMCASSLTINACNVLVLMPMVFGV